MFQLLLHSFQSEWLKKKRTAAAWLTIGGAVLIPAILLAARLINQDGITAAYTSGKLWQQSFYRAWQFMSVMLLPLGLILASSLQAQIEVRNNSWKQLLATPQPYAVSFFAKQLVMLVMLLQFFILFNCCLYLYAAIPALLPQAPYPAEPIPFRAFLVFNLKTFVACLPILGLQYLLSLQFRNFLAPLGAGIGLYVAGMIGINWKFGHLLPYNYAFYVLRNSDLPITALAAVYFALFTSVSFVLYLTKKEKG
jgi:lantibiotic transport system permease protein